MDEKDIVNKAKEAARKEAEVSPEMQKLLEKQRKLKQEEERLKDRMIKLKKQESEKKRKARTHRLIVLGAMVEDILDAEAPEGSDIFEALRRYYMPLVRDEIKSGKAIERLNVLKAKENKE